MTILKKNPEAKPDSLSKAIGFAKGEEVSTAMKTLSIQELFDEIKDEDEKISAEKMKELGLNDGTAEGEEVSELAKLVGNNEEVAKLIYDKVKDGGIASSADLKTVIDVFNEVEPKDLETKVDKINKILNGNENIDEIQERLKLKQGTNKFINVIREKIKEKYPNLSGDMQKLVEKHLVNEVIKNPDVQKHLKYLLGQFQNLDKILEFLSTSASPIGAELSGSSKELRNKIDEIIKDYKLNEEELSRNKKEVVKSLERIMRDLDANMSGGNKVTENLLERFSSSPIGGAMKEILKWILKIPFIGNLVGGFLGLEGKDGREMANNLDSLSANYNSFKTLKSLGQIRDKNGSLVSNGEKPFEGADMSKVEFSAIKDELKGIKEKLPGTKLNEEFWKQAFGKDGFNGENGAKLQFNLNRDTNIDSKEMKSALTDGLDKYKIDIEAKETTSLNTPQSSNEVKPEDGENKIDTNLNGEKVIEESEKIHEPIVLELNGKNLKVEIGEELINFTVKRRKAEFLEEDLLTVNTYEIRNQKTFDILASRPIKAGNDIYFIKASGASTILFNSPQNTIREVLQASGLKKENKDDISKLIGKIFNQNMSKNSSIKQSKTILNNLNMLRYLTNYPKATWVAESLGIKGFNKDVTDKLNKLKENGDLIGLKNIFITLGYNESDYYTVAIDKISKMNSNLLNLKNQKEELQKLAQSEDFSGVNKKLTNLFIEGLTAIVNKA